MLWTRFKEFRDRKWAGIRKMTGNGWGEQNMAAVRGNLPERNIRGGIAEVAAHMGGGP